MELVLYIFAVFFTAAILYFFACLFYFAFTRRSAGLALTLSWKLSLATLLGMILFGFGSILLAALVLHGELAKTVNYSKLRDIVASFLIATVNSAISLYMLFFLAWGIFD